MRSQRPTEKNVRKLIAITNIAASKRRSKQVRLTALRAHSRQRRKNRAQAIEVNADGKAVQHALQDIYTRMRKRANKGKNCCQYLFRASLEVGDAITKKLRELPLLINHSRESILPNGTYAHRIFIQW